MPAFGTPQAAAAGIAGTKKEEDQDYGIDSLEGLHQFWLGFVSC